MSKPLQVLLVEDSDADAELISLELRRHGYQLDCQRVQTEPDFRAHLANKAWDLIIADYRLPRFSALSALQIVRETSLDLPFIIVSGTIGEDVAVAAMKAGAHDYVMKGKLARLVPAVERELREAEIRRARALAEEESQFQAHLLKAVGQAVAATDAEGKVTYWNRSAELLWGWTAGAALGQELKDLILPAPGSPDALAFDGKLRHGQSWFGEMVLCRRDGVSLTVLVTTAPVLDSRGNGSGMILAWTDVTQRKQSELALQSSREQLRALAAKLQSVREEERKVLSRDIHDELGQVLTGLKMELAWVRLQLSTPGKIRRTAILKKIALLGAQIDSSANTIRKLCAELRPGILDDLGLAAAIHWQAQEFSKRTGIECQIAGLTDELQLEADARTAVFRIFQEILTNVARHAQAGSVMVQVTQGPSSLLLEAHDNGRGIPLEDLSGTKSLGLLGMRERAMALGGSIDFLRREEGGTTVRLSVPLPKAFGASPVPHPRARNDEL